MKTRNQMVKARRRIAGCVASLVAAGSLFAGPADERSGAFWVRFDGLPASGSPLPGVVCSAAADGRVKLTLRGAVDEILGDYELPVRERVKAGEWRHVAFNYSLMRRRASVYLDGKWQWENADLELPRLSDKACAEAARDCSFADVRGFSDALPSEELAVATKAETAATCAAVVAEARAAAAKAPVAGLGTWLSKIAEKAERAAAADAAATHPSVTLATLRTLRRDLRNALKVAAEPKERLATEFGVMVTEPLSQEMVLPYDIPTRGAFADSARVYLAQGESEALSLVAFAFRPLTVRSVDVAPLTGPNGAKLAVRDVSLVKRWIRSGLAWLSYHNDRRVRSLVPDLLLHDDSLIRVDERGKRNFLRLDWPTGRVYADCSDPDKGFLAWDPYLPFRDADTLQPVAIPEAGRNQQFLLTFRAERDTPAGDYTGSVTVRTDAGDRTLKLLVKVLPIVLPHQGSSYANLDRTWITLLESFPDEEGATYAERVAFAKRTYRDMQEHSVDHPGKAWSSPERAALAREAGFVPDRVFHFPHLMAGGGMPSYWHCFFPGIDKCDLTAEDRKAGFRAALRSSRRWKQMFERDFPGSELYAIYHSESSAWMTLSLMQGEEGPVLRDLHARLFAHGWDNNSRFATDSQDLHTSTAISSEEAQRWHSAGAEVANYADPFPGTENPMFTRARPGVMMYFAGYDGLMMFGFRNTRTPWNEWAVDWGGDGTYRNFCTVYPQRGGYIPKLAYEGYRESIDDVRYFTRLKQVATAFRDVADHDLRREARRQLRWLDRVERDSTDPEMLRTRRESPDVYALRAGVASRILTLQDMARRKGAALPDPDMNEKSMLGRRD